MGTTTFYVCSGTPYRDPTWLYAIEGLPAAIERMRGIAISVPGEYFVFSPDTLKIFASIDTRAKHLSKTASDAAQQE